MNKTPEHPSVSIVGCGWYGWPLAQHLRSKEWNVKGSKSSREGVTSLRASGIDGYLLNLDPEPEHEIDGALFVADVLIVNIPPARRPDVEQYHLAQMNSLRELITESPIRKVLFISATSVYPDVNRSVTEHDDLQPDKPSGKALKHVEKMWREEPRLQVTVIRFAGLVGGERNPGRFLAGKRNVRDADAPVNLIHLDDCVAITAEILKRDVWGETLNACSPAHPTRRRFYRAAAIKAGLTPPAFSNEPTTAFKQVDSDLLMRRLGYRFQHPDPMDFP